MNFLNLNIVEQAQILFYNISYLLLYTNIFILRIFRLKFETFKKTLSEFVNNKFTRCWLIRF